MLPEPVDRYLSALRYPGRVIVVAALEEGVHGIAYAVTGRSESSRDRRFEVDADGSVHVIPKTVQPKDALRHYRVVVSVDGCTIVGNGSQVDDIAAEINGGAPAEAAVRRIEPEPDGPIFTPRITALISADGVLVTTAHGSATSEGEPQVLSVSVADLPVGSALCAHTYQGSDTTVVPMRRIERLSTQARSAEELRSQVWGALAPDLRVCALAVVHSDPRGSLSPAGVTQSGSARASRCRRIAGGRITSVPPDLRAHRERCDVFRSRADGGSQPHPGCPCTTAQVPAPDGEDHRAITQGEDAGRVHGVRSAERVLTSKLPCVGRDGSRHRDVPDLGRAVIPPPLSVGQHRGVEAVGTPGGCESGAHLRVGQAARGDRLADVLRGGSDLAPLLGDEELHEGARVEAGGGHRRSAA